MVHLGSPGGARCVVWVKWWGCGLGWDTIAVVGAGLGRHFVMIDIFHISRICCKGTHYLRYYRKCASFFISHGLFLRRRGCFNTDFHGWGLWDLWRISTDLRRWFSLTDFADDYLTQISQISRIFLSHRFCGFFAAVGYLTQISRISQIFLSHRLLTSLADFADDYLTQISRISRIFYLTDCWLRSRILRMIFLIAHRFHRFHGFFYLTDFAVFGAAVGYRSQISQISRIFLSHRLC